MNDEEKAERYEGLYKAMKRTSLGTIKNLKRNLDEMTGKYSGED